MKFPRIFGALFGLGCVLAFAACGGGSHSSLPPLSSGGSLLPSVTARTTAAAADLIAINAGGAASGSFSADTDYTLADTWTTVVSVPIDTSAVANPAPQAVYQSQRTGPTVTYTIGGLTAGTKYNVVLSFAELFWTAAGKRTFNISINGNTVVSKFDIFAVAGAHDKAITKTIGATATSAGTIVIALTAVSDNATINAIEIQPTSTATPTPTPPSGGLSINAGGTATGAFVADQDFSANGTWSYANTHAIATTAVSSPAPQAVYQSSREGSSVIYTIPNLTAGSSYNVRLDFAELWFSTSGQRVFNAAINGTNVLSNFDIVATAGAPFTAVAESFKATASSAGTITVAFTAVKNYASINGIEITPATSSTVAFNDYTTFGYDAQRDVFNPNSTAITPASLPSLHLAWSLKVGGSDYNTQTQPVLATEIPGHRGVLFIGGASGNVYAYDAVTGALLWKRATGQETYSCENNTTTEFGIGGTVAYDPASKSVYVVGNVNGGLDTLATQTLYRLNAADGSILGQVNFAAPTSSWKSLEFGHTSVTLGNGMAYVGTGATCDISSWRGRVVAINASAMTIVHTFYTVWNGTSQPWGGGGVWGWGGVSLDFSGNVFMGVGQTDDGETEYGKIVAPYVAAPYEYSGLGDHFTELTSNVTTVEASNLPFSPSIIKAVGGSDDLDLNGTPAIFKPNGVACDPLAALQGKSGGLYIYDTTRVQSGPVASYQLAPSSYSDGFLGDPGYSPVTGLLYAAVPSSDSSLYAPGMIAIDPGCGHPAVVWHSAFGPDSYEPGSTTAPGIPRSVPAASAGGVVLVGTLCQATGSTCSKTTTSSARRRADAAQRIPLICCAPPSDEGGAVWALNASTGAVLNGGNPLFFTAGPPRMPATIDGDWVFEIDNGGHLYALTTDPSVPAAQSKTVGVSP